MRTGVCLKMFKMIHLIGKYLGDLVGQEAGMSSCQEGLDASGHVIN